MRLQASPETNENQSRMDIAQAFLTTCTAVFVGSVGILVVALSEAVLFPRGRGLVGSALSTLRLLSSRASLPPDCDPLLHRLAPVLALIPPAAVVVLIPAHSAEIVPGPTLPVVLALPLLSTGAIGIAGYASGNRLALLDALRSATARAALFTAAGAAGIGAARLSGSTLIEVAQAQSGPSGLWSALPAWGVLSSPVLALTSLVALALLHGTQHPRTTLLTPWFAEASGAVRLGHLLFLKLDVFAMALGFAFVFLGGCSVPGMDIAAFETFFLIAKAGAAIWAAALVRRVLDEVRTETVASISLLVLLPAALIGAGIAAYLRG